MRSNNLLVFVLVAVMLLVTGCGDAEQLRPLTDDDISGILWNTRDAVFDAEMGYGADGQLGISDEWFAPPGYDSIRYVYYGNEALGWIPALRNGNMVEVSVFLERDKFDSGSFGWKYSDWAWTSSSAKGKFKDGLPWITTDPNQNIALAWVLIVPDIRDDVNAFATEQGIDSAEILQMDIVAIKLKDIALLKIENDDGFYVLKYQYKSGKWNRAGFKKTP